MVHLCEIEAIAVGQDGSRAGPIAEGQHPGIGANPHSRPQADLSERPLPASSITHQRPPIPAMVAAHVQWTVLSDFLHLASSLGRKGCVMPEVLILCGFATHKLDRPLLLALCVCGELLSMEAVMLKAREHIPVQHFPLNGKVQHSTKEDHVLVDRRRGKLFLDEEGSLELLHRESLDGRADGQT